MEVRLGTLTGTPAVSVGGRQHRLAPLNLALLVRLRYAEHPIPRSDLVKLFWPNTAGRPNLSTALRALRSVLGEAFIPSNEDPVALGRELPADTDLVEAAARNPTGEAVRAALAAYTAPFLIGYESRLPTLALAGWVAGQRERYRSLLLAAVEAACRGAAAADAWDEVVALAAAADERGLTSDALGELRAEAARRRSAPPAPPATKRGISRLARLAWIPAAALLAVSVFALARHTGGGPCEVVVHLVRKELKPETNIPIAPGGTVSPVWVLRNDGRCAWDSTFAVRRVSSFGPRPVDVEAEVVPVGRTVPPGDTVAISHRITAPGAPGDYGEQWVLQDGEGRPLPVDGRPELPERFQVLPHPLLACDDTSARAALLGTSYPDSARVLPHGAFVATWTVINRGKCIWRPGQVAIRFDRAVGPRMSDPRVVEIRTQEPIAPSYAYTFEVPMRAPASGRAVEEWSIQPGTAAPAGMLALHASVQSGSGWWGRREARECRPGEEIAGWMRSERVQDGTVVQAGTTVRKAWTLRNESECTWAPRSLTFRLRSATGREKPATTFFLARAVPPRATYTFAVPVVVPPGKPVYEERWEIVNRKGGRLRIGQVSSLSLSIRVRDAPRPAGSGEPPEPRG
jgi:hypothetical protein